MANIPNTTTSGQVLTSVGDGSNASKWAVFSGSGSTLPTGTSTGQMIWWNGTAWIVTSTTGLATNYVMSWNGTAWVPTPGGALSNQGWTSASPITATLPVTTPGKMVEVTGITGFSSYLIGFNITAKNGDATTGHNLNAYIYQSGSSVAQSQQFMVNNQIGSTTVSYIALGLSSGTTYSFAGYAYSGGATTGTVNFATITVLGIA